MGGGAGGNGRFPSGKEGIRICTIDVTHGNSKFTSNKDHFLLLQKCWPDQTFCPFHDSCGLEGVRMTATIRMIRNTPTGGDPTPADTRACGKPDFRKYAVLPRKEEFPRELRTNRKKWFLGSNRFCVGDLTCDFEHIMNSCLPSTLGTGRVHHLIISFCRQPRMYVQGAPQQEKHSLTMTESTVVVVYDSSRAPDASRVMGRMKPPHEYHGL